MGLRQDAETTCNLHSLSSLRVGRGGHMSKKHLIALADKIREYNRSLSHIIGGGRDKFTDSQLNVLADWCRSENPAFNRGVG